MILKFGYVHEFNLKAVHAITINEKIYLPFKKLIVPYSLVNIFC